MSSASSIMPAHAGAIFGKDDAMLDALSRWLELSEVQRRAFRAVTEEIAATATVIEESTIDLSERFQNLADTAAAQSARVTKMAEFAKFVAVSGEQMPVTEASAFVQTALSHAIEALMSVSGQATRLASTLNEVERDIVEVEHCATRIDAINRQARFVALNASIEAQRAEGSGGTFKVIAHELRDLSQATDAASQMVRERIGSVARAIRTAHADLMAIGGTDVSDYAATRHQLDAILTGMADRTNALEDVLSEAMAASADVSGTIARLVTGIQFQDRTNQHLTHVIGTVESLGEAIESLQHHTRQSVPRLARPIQLNSELLHRLVEQHTLGGVRERFLTHLLDKPPEAATQPAEPVSGDVELWD